MTKPLLQLSYSISYDLLISLYLQTPFISQSNKVCLPHWPFKFSVKCGPPPPPLLSTQCSPARTLSCISHYNHHITKYFTFISNKLHEFLIRLLLYVPFLLLFVYKSYLTSPHPLLPTLSISVPYGCTFSSLATKTPCKFQHNT